MVLLMVYSFPLVVIQMSSHLCRYFFHASSTRELENDQEDEDADMGEAEARSSGMAAEPERSQTADIQVKEEKEDLHVDWFKAEEADSFEVNNEPEDTETEDDSDNDDVTEDAEPTLDNEEDVDMVSSSLFG